MGTFYDREIEYLESTGTQYIDTGVIYDYSKNLRVECDIIPISNERTVITGNYNGSSASISIELGGTSNNHEREPRFFTSLTQSSSSDSLWANALTLNEKYKIVASYDIVSGLKELTCQEITVSSTYSGTTYGTFQNILLFLDHRSDKTPIANGLRISRFRLLLDNIPVRDMIPVRIGNVGYMFDRVTCQLFGNAGTGNFVLGDDMYDARVEYVGTRGLGKAFPTGYVPTGTDIVIDMSVKFQGFTAKTGAFFYTWNSDTTTECYCLWRNGTTNNRLTIRCGNKQSQASTVTYTLSTGTTYNFRVKWGQAAINYGTYTINTTAATNQNPSPLYLSTSYIEQGINQDIYYFKVYKASVLVCDLIPVRKGQTPCVYDRVTNRTFEGYGTGTGSLVMGNDVPDIPSDYDAELDYIIFDSSQSINTGLYGNLNTEVELTCRCPSAVNMSIFGARLVSGNDGITSYRSYLPALYANIYDNSNHRAMQSNYYNDWVTIKINKDSRQIKSINKTLYTTNNIECSTNFITPNTMRIGGFESVISDLTYRNFVGCLSTVKIWQNNTLVRDYIPVKKYNIGYLYDKVTNKLFGNDFPSSFALGPIKEKPAPIIPLGDGISRYFSRRDLLIEDAKIKPYVTSGLVFHLDGEDYDDTTKTWEDRVAHYIFTMTNTTVSTDGLGGVYFNGNAYSTYANFMAHAASSFTLEVVYNKTGANASVFDGGTGYWIGYRRVGNNVWRQTGTAITVCPDTYGKVTHALTNAVSIYNGKSLGFTTGSTYYNRGTNTNGYLGRDNNNQYRMVGNVYQIRLYNRKLTNAEIFHNQEIDRKRYGITFK